MSDIDRTIDDRTCDDCTTYDPTIYDRLFGDHNVADPLRSPNDSVPPPVAARAKEHGNSFRGTTSSQVAAGLGGLKFGSAFFGWLTATATVAVITAVLAAIGTAIGLGGNANKAPVADARSLNAGTSTLVIAIVLALILLIAFYFGGYVAGRMTLLDGIRQGVAVWLWGIVVTGVLVIVGVITGRQFNVLATLNDFPRIPVSEKGSTTSSLITVVVALLITLSGAILGGLAGMRYHRRVNRAALRR